MPLSYCQQFKLPQGNAISLDTFRTAPDSDLSEADISTGMKEAAERLCALQELLYAEHKRAMVICLQGMDAAGKDGIIRHALGAMNPQGCRVISLGPPEEKDNDHDFLWRFHRYMPAKGEIYIFNRSHYETVLIDRVHGRVPKEEWKKRYGLINDFERLLSESGTHILKFFLHVGKDEQFKRLKERLDRPEKHWKASEDDFKEREHWDAYMEAYADTLEQCNTPSAPWFLIPSDNKSYRNLAVMRVIQEYMESLNMRLPDRQREIEEMRRKYL